MFIAQLNEDIFTQNLSVYDLGHQETIQNF